jgi:hypothetical protein
LQVRRQRRERDKRGVELDSLGHFDCARKLMSTETFGKLLLITDDVTTRREAVAAFGDLISFRNASIGDFILILGSYTQIRALGVW